MRRRRPPRDPRDRCPITRKIRYKSESRAVNDAMKVSVKTGKAMNVYRCNHCHDLHVGGTR